MKKVAIMQPYFLPYIGYFSLIKHTDEFILFDTVQFIRHGWIERNRVLKQTDDWMYIQVPLLKGTRETLIQDTFINNEQPWKEKIFAQLQHYKKTAPYYDEVLSILHKVFEKDFDKITTLNKEILVSICEYLSIYRPIRIFSEMGLVIEPANAPDEWALHISQSLGDIDEYWNPPGGMDFFDKSKYEKANIKLRFQSVNLTEYDQKRTSFTAGLSIIDVMMFNSPEEINEMLDSYELI